jgi:outer membrane protein assembly factor BamB
MIVGMKAKSPRLRGFRHVTRTAILTVVVASAAAAESWNQFRGPTGDGRAGEADLPVEWSETRNVRWKTAIPGKAWASPVESEGRVWLANATADGRRLSVLCIDAATGRIDRDITLFEPAEPAFCHEYNSHASPTPVVVGGRVFVHFGSAGTACLAADTAEILWRRQDLPCDHHRGPGSSPIPFENLLIVNFDGFDLQYVIALDQQTGRTVWKADRTIDYGADDGDLKKAYCTPAVFEHGGRLQLVSPGAVGTVAYDPRTGRELWKVHHGGYNAAARPLCSHGLVVINTCGGDKLLAVRPDGTGDVTKTHVAWRFGKSTPTRPSQAVVGDHLYMVNDTGVFTCLDLRTGEPRWQERRTGRHSAALVESQGRLYACDEDGTTLVVDANPERFRLRAENRLENGCMASPAVVGDDLVIRTKTHLYLIGAGDAPAR